MIRRGENSIGEESIGPYPSIPLELELKLDLEVEACLSSTGAASGVSLDAMHAVETCVG